MKVAFAAALILCVALLGSIQAKFKKPKYCVGENGKHYLRGEHYDDKVNGNCIRYTCVRKGKKLKMSKKKVPCAVGSAENVNVTALELNVQSLNDTMQTLQDTMQSVLELMTTLQTTADKQGTCMSDLSSSHCPPSAAGKIGIVDGIVANNATISTNMAYIATNKAFILSNQDGMNSINHTCSSIQSTATKLETCLGDVNSVSCPSSKGGKTSVPDAIMKNKDDVETYHPDTTTTITPTSPTITSAASSTITAVLWLASKTETIKTLKLPEFTPASCKVSNPDMDLYWSDIQEIQGKLYSCDHRLCQTYSAEDNTWKTIPGKKFKFQRELSAGTVIGDKWIVQGGRYGSGNSVKTAEVWSPGTGNWEEAPQYKSPLPVRSPCLLNINGKIMQIGGYDEEAQVETNKCFLDGQEIASLKSARNGPACAMVLGEVWVAGGHNNQRGFDGGIIEIYDSSSNKWKEGPKLPEEIKKDWTPKLIPYEGDLYYVGGQQTSKMYKLNLNQIKWEEVGNITKGWKSGHIVNTYCDDTTTTITPTSTTTTTATSSTTTAGLVNFIAGGRGGAEKDIEFYQPSIENLTCSISPPPLDNYWSWHTTFYHDFTIYLCGGHYTRNTCISYSNNTTAWRKHSLQPTRFRGHTSVVLKNTLFLVGGISSGNWNYLSAASTPLPLADSPVFTAVPNLDYKGVYQCSVKIDQDNLVIIGGYYNYRLLSTVTQYNTKTSNATSLPSLIEKREDHGCVMVEMGKIKWLIVTGGTDSRQTTEMLKLGSSSWVFLGNLNVGRRGHSMVADRGVMVMGGDEDYLVKVKSVELLDWVSKKWKVIHPSLKTGRYNFGGVVEIPTSMFDCPDWTIIQRRGQYGNDVDYFYKDFKDYENGFGSVDGELWIGLKKLAALTKDGEWELQVDLTDWDDKNYHAKYDSFSVGPAPTYKLHVGGFKDGESTLGDSLASRAHGSAFSARDKDQDTVSYSCAEEYKGGWWYKNCYSANLNGFNFAQQKDDPKGIRWWAGKDRGHSGKTWMASVMKIKRVKV